MSLLSRLSGAILGRQEPTTDQEDEMPAPDADAAPPQDEAARETVRQASQLAVDAQAEAGRARARFWREIEHADRVTGARR